MILAAAAAFIPVSGVADVTTSNGKTYRVETCFVSPERLSTRFIYPDRATSFTIRDGATFVAQSDQPEQAGAEAERRFAFGHNFHAIAYNAAHWRTGETYLPFGGTMAVLARTRGTPSKMRLDLPDTTPIELRFGEWRRDTPYRLELVHAGVTYDYRYRSIERRCDLN